MLIECGKCCNHSAKSLKICGDTDPYFNLQDYDNLREIDYYQSVSEFLQFIDRDQFSPGFAVNLAQHNPITESVAAATFPEEDESAVSTLMILSSGSIILLSTPLLDKSIETAYQLLSLPLVESPDRNK